MTFRSLASVASLTSFLGCLTCVLGCVAGCSGSNGGTGFPGQPDATAPTTTPDAGPPTTVGGNGNDSGSLLGNIGDGGSQACTGIACQVQACGGGATTSLSGTVYDPGGNTPLYNVVVYVPNAPLDPFKAGPTCDQCGVVASGSPITSTLTDEKGNFTLKDVPVGANIPLVMQVGKWRRQVKIPTVNACADNPITDKNLTRLPKNQSEGDIPQMALTTGGCDALECLFHKMGIDDSEFTSSTGKGRVQVYTGTGGATIAGSTDATPFWSSQANLMKYDIVLMSCECGPNPETKPAAAVQAMHDYASAGGRVFGTHYHYYWFQSGPADFQGTATWTPDMDTGDSALTYSVDQTFPKGKSFAEWLVNVGASTTLGSIDLNSASGDVAGINAAEAQQWIYNATPESAKYMTFNTPVGKPAAQQCGRVVYSDLHVTGSGETDFPADCDAEDPAPLTAQEKALEFLFFDLSSCIQDPTKPPPPPPAK
ncbi:MAG TPA: carboxypeptidase regulatory-like domain-containing protein [Polyangiaceae bacterium]|jgi:hypothetical protein